jgi:hypothetical protein
MVLFVTSTDKRSPVFVRCSAEEQSEPIIVNALHIETHYPAILQRLESFVGPGSKRIFAFCSSELQNHVTSANAAAAANPGVINASVGN